MSEPHASPQQAAWLDWIPLPAMVLANDGSAVAVNKGWATLSPVDAVGQGWLEAVEPVFRPALRATLRRAATIGEPGSADCPVTGPRGGRWTRWWWQPLSPDGLVVCVAVIDDGQAGVVPVGASAVGPLAQEHIRAGLSAGISAELAMAVVHRIFQAGLALESAAGLLPGPAVMLVVRVLDDLDQLVRDIRSAALRPRTRLAAPLSDEEQ